MKSVECKDDLVAEFLKFLEKFRGKFFRKTYWSHLSIYLQLIICRLILYRPRVTFLITLGACYVGVSF